MQPTMFPLRKDDNTNPYCTNTKTMQQARNKREGYSMKLQTNHNIGMNNTA